MVAPSESETRATPYEACPRRAEFQSGWDFPSLRAHVLHDPLDIVPDEDSDQRGEHQLDDQEEDTQMPQVVPALDLTDVAVPGITAYYATSSDHQPRR